MRATIAHAMDLHKRYGLSVQAAMFLSGISWDLVAPAHLRIRPLTEKSALLYCDILEKMRRSVRDTALASEALDAMFERLLTKAWFQHDLLVGLETPRGRPRVH